MAKEFGCEAEAEGAAHGMHDIRLRAEVRRDHQGRRFNVAGMDNDEVDLDVGDEDGEWWWR